MQQPKPQLSYYGIGSCLLWTIGTGWLIWAFATSDPAGVKLAGLGIAVALPASLLTYVVGLAMAHHGLKDLEANRVPGSVCA